MHQVSYVSVDSSKPLTMQWAASSCNPLGMAIGKSMSTKELQQMCMHAGQQPEIFLGGKSGPFDTVIQSRSSYNCMVYAYSPHS